MTEFVPKCMLISVFMCQTCKLNGAKIHLLGVSRKYMENLLMLTAMSSGSTE
jgi:hypothetical protein